jgi:Flp pilus assembly protein TadG
LSSTTDPRRDGGQVLVLFAGAAVTLMIIAALAFDTGSLLLSRRTQQNAADAAALAGARFLPGSQANARAAAQQVAAANGFTHGTGAANVEITFPTSERIKVGITDRRPTIFAGIIGVGGWDVSTAAVAINQDFATGPFALMALHETACPAFVIEGGGRVVSNGNIQVNSTCATGQAAFRVAGTGTLDLVADNIGCNVSGLATFGGGVTRNDCDPANTLAPRMEDPYAALSAPSPIPGLPRAPHRVDPTTGLPWPIPSVPPAGCPGSLSPATATSPRICAFGGTDSGETWRIYPGYYPGGLNLQAHRFLLEPGIYYMGDGGFRIANAPEVLSVDAATVLGGGTTLGGGVLIYNGTIPDASTNPGPVVLQGSAAGLNLLPFNAASHTTPDGDPTSSTDNYASLDKMVIMQDRSVTETVQIVGSASAVSVRGVVYAPTGQVVAQGNGGTVTLDQAVASTFRISGNAGTINVAYDKNYLPKYSAAGLIE